MTTSAPGAALFGSKHLARAVASVPLSPWMITTGLTLPFMLYGMNADHLMDRVCKLDPAPYGPPIHECLMTYMVLSIGWLGVAYLRGRKLRKEIGSRKLAETRALSLARDDVLTGLLNRRAFLEELERAIARPGDGFAVVLLDLDDFKAINDVQGHAAGDAVLQSVARRLSSDVGGHGFAARLGGDEFAALIRAADSTPPRSVADRLATSLGKGSGRRGAAGPAGASIGVATFPGDAVTAEGLLHAADLAMYAAKRDGGRTLRFFDPVMEIERSERRLREDELRDGIARGEVRPYYQPIIRLADETICGFEVLARWLHPRLGVLPPSEFIAIAEETGQITPLTESVLREACRDLGPLPAALRFAINVSPTQLAEPALAERLVALVRAEGVSPARVEIELTEDAIMGERAAAAIATFRASGMTIALDDFGTGFSGLSTLRSLKFDKLKIDRSFVGNMLESDESRKLVEAILDLGRSFGLAVTAEGIESEALVDALAAKGCAQGQGYLFGKPMPFEAVVELMSRRSQIAA